MSARNVNLRCGMVAFILITWTHDGPESSPIRTFDDSSPIATGGHRRQAGGVQPSAELTEIAGVRLLLINLLKPVAIGQPMTEKTFDAIACR
jgi:hypothetical protein